MKVQASTLLAVIAAVGTSNAFVTNKQTAARNVVSLKETGLDTFSLPSIEDEVSFSFRETER
jgi:hypothetical protein